VISARHRAHQEVDHEGTYRAKSGYLTLSLEEIAKVIEYLADGIDSGQSAEAVEWINQYEPILSLNDKKVR
jgi:hypothetical protein